MGYSTFVGHTKQSLINAEKVGPQYHQMYQTFGFIRRVIFPNEFKILKVYYIFIYINIITDIITEKLMMKLPSLHCHIQQVKVKKTKLSSKGEQCFNKGKEQTSVYDCISLVRDYKTFMSLNKLVCFILFILYNFNVRWIGSMLQCAT